jgi:hypothetical protein
MEDIDRTFLKLKRKPLIDVLSQIREEGRIKCFINPSTFMHIATIQSGVLEEYSWSINDVTDEIECQFGYKVLLDEWTNSTY